MVSYSKRALKNMRTYKLPVFAAVLSIAMATVIVGSFFVIFLNVQNLVTHWEAGNRIMIYLADGLTPQQRYDLDQSLGSIEGLTILRYIPKEDGLQYLEEQFGTQTDLIRDLGGNPLPDLYEAKVELDSSAVRNVREIAANLKSLPEISDVEYGRDWIERGHKIMRFLTLLGATLMIIFVAAAVLVIIATIKLTVYALKHELETLRLVGASNGFIAGPFYIQSIFETVLGVVIGLALVYGLYALAIINFRTDEFMLPLTYAPLFMGVKTMGYFILAGIVTGIFGTFIALRGSFRL